jgi:hypothetical protein
VKALRVVAVPPKVQPLMNQPSLGVSAEDPGKFVLGTVPVETDGSANFRLPSGVPVFSQALDARGFAVQTMRTLECGQRVGEGAVVVDQIKLDVGVIRKAPHKKAARLIILQGKPINPGGISVGLPPTAMSSKPANTGHDGKNYLPNRHSICHLSSR